MKTNGGLTEQKVCKRLSGPFPAPAYIVLPQVRNGTGFRRNRTRTADALIISTWPGRGLWIGGVEIKTYLADWKRELADAEKAEMQKWCKYWWIAAPKGLIPQAELPETWGLIEVTETKAFITVKAPATDARPPDILLLCSILRSVTDNYVHVDEVDEQVKVKAAQQVKDKTNAFENMRKDVEEFKEAAGIDLIKHPWRNQELGKAVKLVTDLGLLNGRDRLKRLRDEAAGIVEGCAALLTTPPASSSPSPPAPS